jgi:CBS domain-containing protein
MKVNEIMNKAIAVDFDIGLKKVAKIMSDKNIGSLIVLDKEKIAGIVTERDIMKNMSNINKKAGSVMSKSVVTIDHNETIDNAALIMAEHQIKRLPVTEDGKLIGIITATDIIANSDVLNEDFLFG